MRPKSHQSLATGLHLLTYGLLFGLLSASSGQLQAGDAPLLPPNCAAPTDVGRVYIKILPGEFPETLDTAEMGTDPLQSDDQTNQQRATIAAGTEPAEFDLSCNTSSPRRCTDTIKRPLKTRFAAVTLIRNRVAPVEDGAGTPRPDSTERSVERSESLVARPASPAPRAPDRHAHSIANGNDSETRRIESSARPVAVSCFKFDSINVGVTVNAPVADSIEPEVANTSNVLAADHPSASPETNPTSHPIGKDHLDGAIEELADAIDKPQMMPRTRTEEHGSDGFSSIAWLVTGFAVCLLLAALWFLAAHTHAGDTVTPSRLKSIEAEALARGIEAWVS